MAVQKGGGYFGGKGKYTIVGGRISKDKLGQYGSINDGASGEGRQVYIMNDGLQHVTPFKVE